MLSFLALKKLFKEEILRLDLKDSSNITKIFLQNTVKLCQKNIFYTLSFVLSGRFGLYLGDSWTIRESWHRRGGHINGVAARQDFIVHLC